MRINSEQSSGNYEEYAARLNPAFPIPLHLLSIHRKELLHKAIGTACVGSSIHSMCTVYRVNTYKNYM